MPLEILLYRYRYALLSLSFSTAPSLDLVLNLAFVQFLDLVQDLWLGVLEQIQGTLKKIRFSTEFIFSGETFESFDAGFLTKSSMKGHH